MLDPLTPPPPPVVYLLRRPGAAGRAVPGALSSGCGGGRRAAGWHRRVDVFCHVDTIVQQHLLPHAGGESRGGVPVPKLRQLLQASPAAAPAVGLQAARA